MAFNKLQVFCRPWDISVSVYFPNSRRNTKKTFRMRLRANLAARLPDEVLLARPADEVSVSSCGGRRTHVVERPRPAQSSGSRA